MAEFDAALRDRLLRLEAAAPARAPRLPIPLAMPRRSRRRQLLVLVAATATLALATAAAALALRPQLTPEQQVANAALEQRVLAALVPTFPDGACVDPEAARRGVSASLERLGLSHWSIRPNPGAAESRCVAAAVSAETMEIILLAAIHPNVVSAMEQVRGQLVDGCFDRAQAVAHVERALTEAGIVDFVVSTDPLAPRAAPMDQIAVYEQHVAAGCFVYGSTQVAQDGSGRLVVYLWGPWP